MQGKIVLGYDGSPAAERALDHALAVAESHQGGLVIVHVLEWSPYSFLTQEELAERHKRRTEELARAETAVLAPIKERVKASGVAAEMRIRYGHSAELLRDIAMEEGASQIIVGRDGRGGLAARMFGSTAATLVQIASIPCTIVP